MKLTRVLFVLAVLALGLKPADPVRAQETTKFGPESFLIAYGASTPSLGFSAMLETPCNPPLPKLTDEQLSRLTGIRDQYRIATASKHAEQQAIFHKFGEILSQSQIDKQGVKNLHGKLDSIRGELSQARLNMMLDSAEVFSPEQRKEFHRHMLMQAGLPWPPLGDHDFPFNLPIPHVPPMFGLGNCGPGFGMGFGLIPPPMPGMGRQKFHRPAPQSGTP